MLCTQIVFCFCFDIQNNLCTQHFLSLEFSCTELVIQRTIFLSYCGLVDVRISASEIDLPVKRTTSVFIGTLEMYCPQMNNEDGCHVKFAC